MARKKSKTSKNLNSWRMANALERAESLGIMILPPVAVALFFLFTCVSAYAQESIPSSEWEKWRSQKAVSFSHCLKLGDANAKAFEANDETITVSPPKTDYAKETAIWHFYPKSILINEKLPARMRCETTDGVSMLWTEMKKK